MEEIFTIYIDRLTDGKEEKIQGSVPPNFLDVADGMHQFREDVVVDGKVYRADTHLVMHLNIETAFSAQCKICNRLATHPLIIKGAYLTEEIENIPSRVYDMSVQVRDAILLELPMYSECEGNCPERPLMEAYCSKDQTEQLSPHTPNEEQNDGSTKKPTIDFPEK